MAYCNRRCGNCAYWEAVVQHNADGTTYDHGQCHYDTKRRYAHREHWCGRWERKAP